MWTFPQMKRAVVELILAEEDWVVMAIDPRHPDVRLPEDVKEGAGAGPVVLHIGRRGLVVPIPDLQLNDEHLQATLSFKRCAFTVVIPWDALFYITLQRGQGGTVGWMPPVEASLRAQPPEPKPVKHALKLVD